MDPIRLTQSWTSQLIEQRLEAFLELFGRLPHIAISGVLADNREELAFLTDSPVTVNYHLAGGKGYFWFCANLDGHEALFPVVQNNSYVLYFS